MIGGTMSNSGTDKQQLAGGEGAEEFVVDRIVSHRFRHGRKEYLLAWKGYTEDENTWVMRFSWKEFSSECHSHLGTRTKSGLSGLNWRI